jgi:biotin transport system substrate-specific component
MVKSAVERIERNLPDQVLDTVRQGAIIIAASLFVALCARITLPLPFTPVPLSLQNFGVLLVGLLLGSRRGFAALLLYLAEGASGLPVFTPGWGGIAQLLGPTGGYLIAYPVVAFCAGWIWEHGSKTFSRAVAAAVSAEIILFAGGISWLMLLTHTSFVQASRFALYPFVFGEVIKILSGAGVANRVRRYRAQS